MIKAILFDLDETLIDRSGMMRQFLSEQYQYFEELHGYDKQSFIDSCLVFQRNGYADKYDAYSAALADLGSKHSDLPLRLFDNLREQYGKIPLLFEGVEKVLKTLSVRYKLGLVSNGRTDVQHAKIRNNGIQKYFSAICISESIGCKKPDPEIFLSCLGGLSVNADEAVFVGDNPVADIQPALALGMEAVWVENQKFPEPQQACKKIAHLPELLSIVESLNQTKS